MEKTIWIALASVWTLVLSAAAFSAPLAQPIGLADTTPNGQAVTPMAETKDANIAAMPVMDFKLATAARKLPTHILGAENHAEAVGIILASMLTLKIAVKRRPI